MLMGIEYKILCDHGAIARMEEFARRHAFFECYDAELKLYYFQDTVASERARVGWVATEADGIYFCDNLTSRSAAALILRDLIDHALLYSEQITIREP